MSDNGFRTELKSARFDRFSGAKVYVPIWLPDATVGIYHKPGGEVQVYVDVSWDGGGWICSGSGSTEILAANDLVARLRRLA